MQSTYLFIRGSIGIKEGLGLDELELDLKGKTGLVALSGPNGRGKTTVLELLSLYRTLASRKGKLRHHFFLRDSRVEQKFIYSGDEYHLIWKIDSGSDRSEAFILVNGESVVDGKNKEYDRYIIEKFGTENLFYNSVFCAQGSKNMSNMTPGTIKELFVEFLRIERFEEWRKDSLAGIDFYQRRINILSGEIDVMSEQFTAFINLDKQIKDHDILITDKGLLITRTGKEIERYEAAIADCRIKSEKQKTDIERKARIKTQLEELISKRDQVTTKTKTGTDRFYNKKALLNENLEMVELALADKEDILHAAFRIAYLEKQEQYFSGCYECSIDEQAEFDKDIKMFDEARLSVSDKIKSLEDDLILDGLNTSFGWLQKKSKEIQDNKSDLKDKLEDAKSDFPLMQATAAVTACKEKIALAINPKCSLICPAKDMVKDAQKELPLLEKTAIDLRKEIDEKILDMGAAILQCNEQIIDFDSLIMGCGHKLRMRAAKIASKLEAHKIDDIWLCDAKRELVSDTLILDEFKGFYKLKLSEVRTRISELKVLSSKKPQIEVAEERKVSLAAQVKQLDEQYEAWETEQTGYFDELSKDILSREDSISKIDESLDHTIEKTIEALIREKTTDEVKRVGFTKALDDLKAAAAVLSNDVKKKESLSVSLQEKREIKKSFEKELTEWDYLRLTCSKNGLQALEIDGAAPLVTAEANTLFGQAYDLDWQIKIVTQDPETGKEVFLIKVIRDDGKETDFSNLSGGEKVWVAKALSLGMTLVSKKKSARDFRSVFADEEDGALDAERALEFIQLYRSLMDAGDFDTCLFISHNKDVVAMADHVIDFNELGAL